jgi:hypothetical protein
MRTIDCRMVVWSQARHLSHIRTGLMLLARQGAIRLSQEIRSPPRGGEHAAPYLRDARVAHMEVVVDGALRLYFDAHDAAALDTRGLAECDFYFKRSLAPDADAGGARARLLPMGLYYPVYPGTFDRYEAERERTLGRGMLRFAAGQLAGRIGLGRYAFDVHRTCAPPDPDAEPRVLFMTQVWDAPRDRDEPSEKAAERQAMNAMRAACIERLRRELGPRFLGGINATPYARRHFGSTLLENDALSDRRRYLSVLRGYPICIATTGLHGSIGAKLAEYVAYSKAIVSEPLASRLPGEFADGVHYASFTSVDQCVERTLALMQDAAGRRAMMEHNWRYFRSFVRPDALVRNALAAARPDWSPPEARGEREHVAAHPGERREALLHAQQAQKERERDEIHRSGEHNARDAQTIRPDRMQQEPRPERGNGRARDASPRQ